MNKPFSATKLVFKADDDDDSWYVQGVNYNPVPLPAAVWFMLTAIGGLFASRWLKKSQTA